MREDRSILPITPKTSGLDSKLLIKSPAAAEPEDSDESTLQFYTSKAEDPDFTRRREAVRKTESSMDASGYSVQKAGKAPGKKSSSKELFAKNMQKATKAAARQETSTNKDILNTPNFKNFQL